MIAVPRLVVITPPDSIKNETRIANALLTAGLQRLHVRKPAWDVQQVQNYIAGIEPRFHSHLSVHSWQDMTALRQNLPTNVQGVHHIARARPPAPLPTLDGLIQSASLHSLEELETDWGPALRYAFLSPIFDSISKAGYTAATFDRHRLSQLLSRRGSVPVLALGGVTAQNVAECADMGLHGVAALGTVWGADDPLSAFDEIQTACTRTWGPSVRALCA